MIEEYPNNNLMNEDKFPVGMRVLAVDDDPVFLKLLENLLHNCQYQVTITNDAIKALKMLRENKHKFDLVISDVNMPGMDGFELLELVRLEMDLPVIMLSAHCDTKLVMKGVSQGACDYLLKPVRIEQLMNIWQHVMRRKKFDYKDQNKASNKEKDHNMAGEGSPGITSENNVDQNKKPSKKRKYQSKYEEEDGEENGQENEDLSTKKKPRVVWSAELHSKFVAAVNQLGLEKAFPKQIRELMNVEGLTRENVASHLQKYRILLKKATQQDNMVAAFSSNDPSHLRMVPLDGYGDIRPNSGSGRISSPAVSSYVSSGILSRLNSPAGSSFRGISSSGMIQPGQTQNTTTSVNTLGNFQPSMLPANRSSSLFQAFTTSIELEHSQQRKSTTGIRQLSPIDDSSGFTVATGFPDSRVTVGSANNSVTGVSSNNLMFQGNTQQTHKIGAFRNQFSLGASSLNKKSFDSSNSSNFSCSDLLVYNECDERWQDEVQLSRSPTNPLPFSETFNNDQLLLSSLNVSSSIHIGNSPVIFSSPNAIYVPLEEAGSELKCQKGLIENVIQTSSYMLQQGWEERKQDYNENMNSTFNSIKSMVSSNRVASSIGQSLNQNNAICSKSVDASLIEQFNGDTPSTFWSTELEKISLDTMMKLNDAYILEQMKSQGGLIQNNFGSLDDIHIMSAMVKQDQNEMALMDGEMEFDADHIRSWM